MALRDFRICGSATKYLAAFVLIVIVFVFGFLYPRCTCETNSVAEAVVATVYDSHVRSLPIGDASLANGVALDASLIREAAEGARFESGVLSRMRHPWKGSWLVRVEDGEGRVTFIAVNYNGDFYQILGQCGVWVIDDTLRDRWIHAFLSHGQ